MSPTVRVATGDLAGRRLTGAVRGTRPATARMRDSIFNRPQILDLLPGRVLDCYAGAGFLGIEALSNGATWVDFVERNPAACDVIRKNLSALGLEASARVFTRPVEAVLPALDMPYALVFADPPYDLDATAPLIALLEAGAVANDGLLLWRYPIKRHGLEHPSPDRLGPLARSEERRYGDGALATYRY